jgi:glycosyltransferase involved in cell wall biosynthesis
MISYYLPSGSKMGVGYQAHALANQLAACGHDVVLFSSCGPTLGAHYQTETIPLSGSLRTFKFARALRKKDWSQFDVVHAHSGDFLLWGINKPPHIRTVHGSSLREAIHITGARARLVMSYYAACETVATAAADQAVAVSRNTQRWLPWVRMHIPNGVDLAAFHPGEKSVNPSILFVGTYSRRKRGRLLADIFQQRVLPAVPRAELWMVAEDATPRVGIKAFGRIPDEELQDLYRKAWVFCLPSSYEGFGIPYIEAMASGTPIVATGNAGAIELTENGRFGVVVEEDQLGSAIVNLLNSKEERERYASAGLSHVTQFALDEVVSRYEALYRALIAKRPG